MNIDVEQKQLQQAVIAREIIDLYRSLNSNTDVAEYLDVICFAMARLLNEQEAVIDWDALAATFDTLAKLEYTGATKDLNHFYHKAVSIIKNHSKTTDS